MKPTVLILCTGNSCRSHLAEGSVESGPIRMNKQSVLFLCSHNAARSQIAEALLRKRAGDRFEVASAGLEPTEVHPVTIRVMNELGIDLSRHHANGLDGFLGKENFWESPSSSASARRKTALAFTRSHCSDCSGRLKTLARATALRTNRCRNSATCASRLKREFSNG